MTRSKVFTLALLATMGAVAFGTPCLAGATASAKGKNPSTAAVSVKTPNGTTVDASSASANGAAPSVSVHINQASKAKPPAKAKPATKRPQATASTARGQRFYQGLSSPADLIPLLKASLAIDPTGNRQLSLEKCKKPGDGSCATPYLILTGVQGIDPDAHVQSYEDLYLYLSEMKVREAPKGKWWMTCLVPYNGPGGYTIKNDCVLRTFKKGEHMWESRTGKAVFAQDCTNLINGPEEVHEVVVEAAKPCFEYDIDGRGYPVRQPVTVGVSFYTGRGDELQRLLADECFKAVDGESGQRVVMTKIDCADCRPWQQEAIWPGDIARGTKGELTISVSFPSGHGTLYLPPWYAESSVRFCFTAERPYSGLAPSWAPTPPWFAGRAWNRVWVYSSYAYLVTRSEVHQDLAAKSIRYHAVVTPAIKMGTHD